MKRLGLMCILCLCFLMSPYVAKAEDWNKVEIKYTKSRCNLTKEECSKNSKCTYIEEYKCGIIDLNSINYTCEYYTKKSGQKITVTGYFYDQELQSVSYVSDEVGTDKIVPFVNTDSNWFKDAVVYNKDETVGYYQCPSELYVSPSKSYITKGEQYDSVNRAISVYAVDKFDFALKLQKEKGSNGIMGFAILPDHYYEKATGEWEQLEPLTCVYKKEVDGYMRDISITYHDRENVTAVYSGFFENQLMNKINADYIKDSEYFERWECPDTDSVFIATTTDGTPVISYNKEDLKDYDYVFEFTGGSSSNYYGDNIDYGVPVYGCDVVPEDIKTWITDTLNLVRYIALALVIILGVIDFIKVAASGEADQMKKSGNSFLKRIIAVIILFLLPVIVELILDLVDIAGSDPRCLLK